MLKQLQVNYVGVIKHKAKFEINRWGSELGSIVEILSNAQTPTKNQVHIDDIQKTTNIRHFTSNENSFTQSLWEAEHFLQFISLQAAERYL